MVELEDDGISLSAVRARMRREVLDDECACGSNPLQGARSVDLATASLVGGEAATAPPLPPIAVPVEQLEGKCAAAAAARLQLARLPDGEGFYGWRVVGSRRPLVMGHIADPFA